MILSRQRRLVQRVRLELFLPASLLLETPEQEMLQQMRLETGRRIRDYLCTTLLLQKTVKLVLEEPEQKNPLERLAQLVQLPLCWLELVLVLPKVLRTPLVRLQGAMRLLVLMERGVKRRVLVKKQELFQLVLVRVQETQRALVERRRPFWQALVPELVRVQDCLIGSGRC